MKKTDSVRPAKVALRVRPLSSKELSDGCKSIIRCNGLHQIILGDEKIYDFDYVFNRESTQKEVYETCASELVDKVFNGYDATIFAYGQTGSGKTYTMGTNYKNICSTEESIGIIPRLLADVFKRKEDSMVSETQVSFTFIEIYNEMIYDLMTTKNQQQKSLHGLSSALKLRKLKEVNVNTCKEALQLFEEGCSRRVQEKTFGNQYSSRSHAVYTLKITKYNMEDDAVTSKLNLVDLAGSEACSKNFISNNRYVEGVNINLSLLTLGKVIRALRDASNSSQNAHVPYRDSLLTCLLRDSLKFNSFILMIACINPASQYLTETCTTLNYATTVCCIKTVPVTKHNTAKKVTKTPGHILPPTPAWIKQGLNLTVATPSIRPTPAKGSHLYRNIAGLIYHEVRDAGCSPILKEPSRPLMSNNTALQSGTQESRTKIKSLQGMEFPVSKSVQKTLNEFFTPVVRHVDKENASSNKARKALSNKKLMSSVSSLPVSLLSPIPMKSSRLLTPLKERTNIDSPARNTRSSGRNHYFTESKDENFTDFPVFSTCDSKRHLLHSTYEEEHFRGSPAFNTRTSRKRSLQNTSGEILRSSDDTNGNDETVISSSLLSEDTIAPIPHLHLEDELFNLPRPVKKYNLRERTTIRKTEKWDFYQMQEKNKLRKTEVIGKFGAARTGEILRSSDDTNGNDETVISSSLLSEDTIAPIPHLHLEDELFNLPRPVKKYNLRERTTIRKTEKWDFYQMQEKNKLRKTEVIGKFGAARNLSKKQRMTVQKHEREILYHLNSGSVNDLSKLPLVGPKTACIIITWQKIKGSFRNIKDLKKVEGLPQTFLKKFAKANLISL